MFERHSSRPEYIVQLTKILLLPPKYEIIMLPSNHKFFHIAIAILDFSLLLLVKLSLLILFASFLVSVLCFYIDRSSLKLSLCDSCRSFLLLKAISKRLPLLFANASKNVKERQLLLSQ